jgi:hypothetical protein
MLKEINYICRNVVGEPVRKRKTEMGRCIKTYILLLIKF